MNGDPSAERVSPRRASLVDRAGVAAGAVWRGIASCAGARRPMAAAWRRTLAVVLGATIAGCLLTAAGAWLAGNGEARRLPALRTAAAVSDARRRDMAMLAARLATPGLDARLTMLAAELPPGVKLVAIGDRSLTLRTADPDMLRAGLREGRRLPGYAERGQAIAADGGIDMTFECVR